MYYSPPLPLDVYAAFEQAPYHIDTQNGIPFAPEPGECEICDILWLLETGEGDRVDNLFHLRDAWAARLREEEEARR